MSKTTPHRRCAAAFALLSCLLATGCLGPNNAFRSIHSWNSRVTDSKWGNEAIHVGLWILPVYPLALLADIVVFNSIEFWGGDHPIPEPEEFLPAQEQGS